MDYLQAKKLSETFSKNNNSRNLFSDVCAGHLRRINPQQHHQKHRGQLSSTTVDPKLEWVDSSSVGVAVGPSIDGEDSTIIPGSSRIDFGHPCPSPFDSMFCFNGGKCYAQYHDDSKLDIYSKFFCK